MKRIIYLILFFLPGSLAFASNSADSSGIETDSSKLKVDYYLSQASSLSTDKPLEAVENYRKALLAAPVRDVLWEARIRTAMGRLLVLLKNKEALTQLQKADALFSEYSDSQGKAEAMELTAQFYLKNQQIANAQKKYTDLYKVQLDAGEAVQAGNAAMALTDLSIKTNDYKDAFSYADMAKNAYERVCRRDSLGSAYLKIALIKRKQNKIKLAEFYTISKALPYFSSADYFKGRIMSFDFLGDMYMDQKKYSQAKWFYIQANTQSRAVNDTVGVINSLLDLSIVKVLTENYDLAKRDLDEADELSKGSGSTYLIKSFRSRFPKLLKKLSSNIVQTVDVKEDVAAAETLIPVRALTGSIRL